jgi:hypothetical protein
MSKPKKTSGGAIASTISLADLLIATDGQKHLSEARRRDLRSSIRRVALLLDDDPARIALDLPAIGAKLAALAPAASGLTPKTFANIRANFLAAVKSSGSQAVRTSFGTPLSPGWKALFAKLSAKRAQIGLSRLARFCSAKGTEPDQVTDATIEAFIAAVRAGTLHRKPSGLHRKVAQIWNEIARRPELGLHSVTVPWFRRPPERINWNLLPSSFRNCRSAPKGICKRLPERRQIRAGQYRCRPYHELEIGNRLRRVALKKGRDVVRHPGGEAGTEHIGLG